MLGDIFFLALNRARLGCCLHKSAAPQQISRLLNKKKNKLNFHNKVMSDKECSPVSPAVFDLKR